MDLVTEGGKEVIFGGLAGLAAGYVSKKLGSHLAGAVITSGFVVFRAAVYDGQYSATWSPLARDDHSFTEHLKRKARKRPVKGQSRAIIDNCLLISLPLVVKAFQVT